MIQSINFYSQKDLENRTLSHTGFSLIILHRHFLNSKNDSLSFLLQKNDARELTKLDKDSNVLEILLNLTFYFWKQNEQSIPLKVTNELKQLTHLLFTYYIHGKLGYSVDKVVFSLVDRIIKLNSDRLLGDNSFITLLKFMEENVTKPLSVSDFCKAIHLSESSVNRLCYAHTGMTVMRLFRKIQCWETERLLAETSLTIHEISKMMGFKSSKSFSTMYRRNEGITLMEKRKELRGGNGGNGGKS
ncbi:MULTISPECIES: helix-turn-helix domain-containing protein [unclassified Enterococcus]|uniref:helix-turn-helix domain-containing protein n=1 Tax=unclassified Enterococcus TaxID=2608891 RepID=UPI000A34F79A|nr:MULTISPECIES: AraC family transcriptional regulator [unclassified Enterococcus]OTO77319.1 hypothetical protein A5865_001195 [Enterococcus sp. 12E11_DIV0728]OUZ16512.1 hypothetical protein A5868_001433 [Enterococcus sp. 12F9_DIV0723]